MNETLEHSLTRASALAEVMTAFAADMRDLLVFRDEILTWETDGGPVVRDTDGGLRIGRRR